MKKILVLCTGNSCRSQIAEGYLRYFGGDQVSVYSAGVETHGVNPRAIETMKADGIDISGHTSNTLTEYLTVSFDLILTVCDHAQELCPVFPGQAKKMHHNFPDPAKTTGSEEEIQASFRQVRDQIKTYCQTLLASMGRESNNSYFRIRTPAMKNVIFLASLLLLLSCNKEKTPAVTKAKFSVSGFDQPVPCTISFTNSSTQASSQEWFFGDGTRSTERNPTHTYTAIGDYYIKLKITGATGTDSVCSILSLNQVSVGRSTFAYFLDKCSGVPANVSFVSLNPLSQFYNWDFGSGQTALIKNPIVNIPTAGNYTIKFSSQINGVRDTFTYNLVIN